MEETAINPHFSLSFYRQCYQYSLISLFYFMRNYAKMAIIILVFFKYQLFQRNKDKILLNEKCSLPDTNGFLNRSVSVSVLSIGTIFKPTSSENCHIRNGNWLADCLLFHTDGSVQMDYLDLDTFQLKPFERYLFQNSSRQKSYNILWLHTIFYSKSELYLNRIRVLTIFGLRFQ